MKEICTFIYYIYNKKIPKPCPLPRSKVLFGWVLNKERKKNNTCSEIFRGGQEFPSIHTSVADQKESNDRINRAEVKHVALRGPENTTSLHPLALFNPHLYILEPSSQPSVCFKPHSSRTAHQKTCSPLMNRYTGWFCGENYTRIIKVKFLEGFSWEKLIFQLSLNSCNKGAWLTQYVGVDLKTKGKKFWGQ